MPRRRAGPHLQHVIKTSRHHPQHQLAFRGEETSHSSFSPLTPTATSKSSVTQPHQVSEQFSLIPPVCQKSQRHIHEYLLTRFFHANETSSSNQGKSCFGHLHNKSTHTPPPSKKDVRSNLKQTLRSVNQLFQWVIDTPPSLSRFFFFFFHTHTHTVFYFYKR